MAMVRTGSACVVGFVGQPTSSVAYFVVGGADCTVPTQLGFGTKFCAAHWRHAATALCAGGATCVLSVGGLGGLAICRNYAVARPHIIVGCFVGLLCGQPLVGACLVESC